MFGEDGHRMLFTLLLRSMFHVEWFTASLGRFDSLKKVTHTVVANIEWYFLGPSPTVDIQAIITDTVISKLFGSSHANFVRFDTLIVGPSLRTKPFS